MTIPLPARLFFSGEIYRNLEGTGSIEERTGSVYVCVCVLFQKTAQPVSFLAIVPGASVMEASFFGFFRREGRNCHRKSSVESFLCKRRILKRERREGERGIESFYALWRKE